MTPITTPIQQKRKRSCKTGRHGPAPPKPRSPGWADRTGVSAPEVTRTSRCVREAGRPKKNACRLLRGASKSQGCGKEPSVSGCYLSAGEVLPAPGEQPLFLYTPQKSAAQVVTERHLQAQGPRAYCSVSLTPNAMHGGDQSWQIPAHAGKRTENPVLPVTYGSSPPTSQGTGRRSTRRTLRSFPSASRKRTPVGAVATTAN